MEDLRRKGPGREAASRPCVSCPALPRAGTGRHTGNVPYVWKGTLRPGRPTRLQSLPTLSGSERTSAACASKRCGVEEVASPCPPGHLPLPTWTVKTFARAICAEAAVPTKSELPSSLFHSPFVNQRVSKLEVSARRKHELKREASRAYQICS